MQDHIAACSTHIYLTPACPGVPKGFKADWVDRFLKRTAEQQEKYCRGDRPGKGRFTGELAAHLPRLLGELLNVQYFVDNALGTDYREVWRVAAPTEGAAAAALTALCVTLAARNIKHAVKGGAAAGPRNAAPWDATVHLQSYYRRLSTQEVKASRDAVVKVVQQWKRPMEIMMCGLFLIEGPQVQNWIADWPATKGF